jgi:hypothetical protein
MPEREIPMAGCPGCGAPLVLTFAFSGSEFYCVECGRHVTFFGPVKLNASEHQERYDALRAEWDEHVGGQKLLSRGGRHADCPRCVAGEDYDHGAHATETEHAAHQSALTWMKQRASGGSHGG